jgi:hypothetical protein
VNGVVMLLVVIAIAREGWAIRHAGEPARATLAADGRALA